MKGDRLGRGRAAAVLGPEAMFVPRLEVVRARRRRGFSAGLGAGLEEPEEVLGGGCRRGGGGTGNQEWLGLQRLRRRLQVGVWRRRLSEVLVHNLFTANPALEGLCGERGRVIYVRRGRSSWWRKQGFR